ncbi:hypothetical protein [Priestia koreensis]|uniref:hypothetical protein n=1 Tax=Priestia koreensis TaxID=284581 RepID=UPI00203B5028|nr:hypothetical protein [Priestia koreensis]MCM3006822.1 hypothetical protein [Priestia koreensis]
MKKKLIGSALTLSLLLGGATLNSNSVKAAPLHGETVKIEQEAIQAVEPHFWAAAGRAAAFSLGKVVGKAMGNAIFGNSNTSDSQYEYEDVNNIFDH